MTKILFLMLVGTLAAVTIAENNDSGINPIPPQPPIHPVTTTEQPKPPTTTTSSTTSKTTPTTVSTPSTKPTTTSKSTTTTSTTTSKPTSPITTTSTTAKPTQKPTPAPAPKPVDPVVGTWQVNSTDSKNICLLVQFALQIEVPYNTTFNKTQHGYVDIPKNANATGVCKNDSQAITLQWNGGTDAVDMITLNFTMDNATKKYRLADIEIRITPTNESFPDFNETNVLNLSHKYAEFATTVSKSYKCAKKQELNLTDIDAHQPRGSIYVSHLQFEAFHNITNKEFSSAEDCAPFDTPDVVPIAVGCALAALVIIVLIAYLIGRRRRQARGYLSMFTETKRESDYIPMKNLSCFQ